MAPKDPIAHKASFLAQNQMFNELELADDSKSIGKIEDIDLVDNEVWFLQCPKGTDVKHLEGQKLKIPGRTNLNGLEAVSVDFIEGAEQHAFAYCNRKGVYDLRLLPLRGTIVLRNRLKAADPITEDRIEECCAPAKRVPMPSAIRVRHPLLGHQYEEKLDLEDAIVERLLAADKTSAQALKDSLLGRNTEKRRISDKLRMTAPEPIAIESEVDDEGDAVVFVSEEVKTKRKHSENKNKEKDEPSKKKKMKKSKKNDVEEVANDLRWLQHL